MFNGGDVGAKFEVTQKPFEDCQAKNYGHEVFECLNPTGDIGPRSWAPVRIRFSPIEIRQYSVSTYIIIIRHLIE